MSKDLKNVLITFGLIAIVATGGSLIYRRNLQDEGAIASIKQEKLQRIKNNKIIADQLKKEALIKEQIAQNQLDLQQSQNTNTSTSAQTQADLLAKQKALLLAQQQAEKLAAQKKAQLLAEQQALARAQAQAAVVSPSRQSRAS